MLNIATQRQLRSPNFFVGRLSADKLLIRDRPGHVFLPRPGPGIFFAPAPASGPVPAAGD